MKSSPRSTGDVSALSIDMESPAYRQEDADVSAEQQRPPATPGAAEHAADPRSRNLGDIDASSGSESSFRRLTVGANDSKDAVSLVQPSPSEVNTIPFRLNRWIYLSIAFILYFFHGALVMNWQPILDYLIRDGVYSWKCYDTDVLDSFGTCAEQRKALALLGTLGSVFIFCGSPFGAYLTDTLGPKFAITIGLGVFIISWLFLAVSSQSAQLYIPSFVLQGLAVELAFFPMLTISNLFPKNRGLVLAILGTARSLSQYWTSAQQSMSRHIGLSATMWVCVVVSGAWLVIMFFLAPSNKFKLIHEDGKVDDLSTLTPRLRNKIELYAVGKKIVTLEYLLWLVYFALGLARVAFYGISVADQHPDVVTAFSYMAPLSFIPCPFFGWMADAFGGIPVLLTLNALATIMYACLLGGRTVGAEWTSMVIDVILLSFMASMTYVYCDSVYSQLTQAKLAGLSMLVGGLLMFINTPIYNWGVDSHSFLGPNLFYFIACCAMYPVLGFLWMRRKSMPVDKLPTEYQQAIEKAMGERVGAAVVEP